MACDGHCLAPEAATARLKGVDAVGRERAADRVQGRVGAQTATIEATARMMIAQGQDKLTKLAAEAPQGGFPTKQRAKAVDTYSRHEVAQEAAKART